MDIVEGTTVAYCGNLARTDRCKSFHSSLANIRMRVDDLNERQKAGSLPNAAVGFFLYLTLPRLRYLKNIAQNRPYTFLALVKTAVGSVYNPTIARSVDGKTGSRRPWIPR